MRVLLFIMTISTATTVYAEEEWLKKSIQKGNWNLGASGIIQYESQLGTQIQLVPNLQYFFKDHLSFGLVGDYSYYGSRGYTASLGLIGTYYFAESERGAYFLSQDIKVGQTEWDRIANSQFLSATTTLGYNYFLNEHVAIGPRVRWTTSTGKTEGTPSESRGSLGILFGTSIYF